MSTPVLLVVTSDNRVHRDNLALEKESIKTTIKELYPNTQLLWFCIDDNNLTLVPPLAVSLFKCLPVVIYFPQNEWNNYMHGIASHNVSIMNSDLLSSCDKKYHKAIIAWLDMVYNLPLTSSDIITRRKSLIDSIKKYLKLDIYGTMLCNYLNTMTHEEFDKMTTYAVHKISDLIGPIACEELLKIKEVPKMEVKVESKPVSNVTEETCKKVVNLIDVCDDKIAKLSKVSVKQPNKCRIVRKLPSKDSRYDGFRLRPYMLKPKDFVSYKFNIADTSMEINYDLSCNILKFSLRNPSGHVSTEIDLN